MYKTSYWHYDRRRIFLVGISLIKVTIFGKSLGQLDFFSSLSSPTSWGNKANSDFHPRSISFVYMITFWLNIFGIYTPFLKVKKKPIGTWNSYFWQHNILLLRTLMIISAYQTDHCAPLQRKLKIFSKMKINHGKFSFCWVSFKASFLLGRAKQRKCIGL